jgi:ubiquinone biosynthesis monooxygenase Coq7
MLKLDQLIIQFDQGLRTLFAPAHTVRKYPDEDMPDVVLSDEEKRHAAALMRINHVGEVCAQALYQGQAVDGTQSADPRSVASGGLGGNRASGVD